MKEKVKIYVWEYIVFESNFLRKLFLKTKKKTKKQKIKSVGVRTQNNMLGHKPVRGQ